MGIRRLACILTGFATMSTPVLVILTVLVFGTAHADEPTALNNRSHRQMDFNPGVFGVASVAGVTSRNGHVSTTGGIHFYPAPEGAITSGEGYYNPLAFTKATNGKYASGSVNIHPGALGVSSSAQAGYVNPGFNSWPLKSYHLPSQDNQWLNHENQWPIQDNQWIDQWPLQNFYALGQRKMPWYKTKFDPQSRDVRTWINPSFNPFLNLWR